MTTVRLRAVLGTSMLLLAGCTPWQPDVALSPGAEKPGWTGRAQVVGNTSTVASNADATYLQQKWGVGSRQR